METNPGLANTTLIDSPNSNCCFRKSSISRPFQVAESPKWRYELLVTTRLEQVRSEGDQWGRVLLNDSKHCMFVVKGKEIRQRLSNVAEWNRTAEA